MVSLVYPQGTLSKATRVESHQIIVGLSEVSLPTPSLRKVLWVFLKADDDNTSPVFIGESGVSDSSGFRLNRSQGVLLDCSDVSSIRLISSASDQKVSVLYGGV